MNVARPIFRSATLSGMKSGAAVGISFWCMFAVFILHILSGSFPVLKIHYYFKAIKSTLFYTIGVRSYAVSWGYNVENQGYFCII